MNDLSPVVYEDGRQSRDLVFVEDVARANMLVATDERADGGVFNVGTGNAVAIGELASTLAGHLGKEIDPSIPGEFRPGEMRALISDISKLQAIGYSPQVDLSEGVARYLEWIADQGDIGEYFSAAEKRLRARNIVKKAAAGSVS